MGIAPSKILKKWTCPGAFCYHLANNNKDSQQPQILALNSIFQEGGASVRKLVLVSHFFLFQPNLHRANRPSNQARQPDSSLFRRQMLPTAPGHFQRHSQNLNKKTHLPSDLKGLKTIQSQTKRKKSKKHRGRGRPKSQIPGLPCGCLEFQDFPGGRVIFNPNFQDFPGQNEIPGISGLSRSCGYPVNRLELLPAPQKK